MICRFLYLTRSNPLNRNGEHIAQAALGLDDAWRTGIAFEFAPQSKNLHVDTAIEDILMHSRGSQQVLAAERALRRLEESQQQRVFAFGQCYRSTFRVSQPPSPAVELPTTKSKAATVGIARRRGAPDIGSS
jgi:hypothetical protein